MKIVIDGVEYKDDKREKEGIEVVIEDWESDQVAISFSDESREVRVYKDDLIKIMAIIKP